MMKKRRCNSDQTLTVNNIKIYRRYIKAMDCLISLLLVSDFSQKREHKKIVIIPGEQGRAGDVPYTIVKRKNRFFMFIHFHLQPAATALTIDEFRKLISIILRTKNYRDNICVSRFLWCFLVTKTRPDTRQSSRGRLGRSSNTNTARNSKMWWTDGRTDLPTDRLTDRHGKV